MIYLREITLGDMKIVNKWRNDKKLIDALCASFRYINLETDEEWFKAYMMHRMNEVRCGICLEETDELVGVISLVPIDWQNQKAYFQIMIGSKMHQGKGIGYESTKLMLDHAFYNLNINRVYLKVMEENVRAINLYKKVGFIEEGYEDEAIYKNGEFKKQICMRILKREYMTDEIIEDV